MRGLSPKPQNLRDEEHVPQRLRLGVQEAWPDMETMPPAHRLLLSMTGSEEGHAMYDRILCAHDLSDHSNTALRTALDLGREMKATVHVLHVVREPLSIPPGFWFAVPDLDVQSFEQRIRLAATEELERLVREATCPGDPQPRLHVQVGEPGEAILARAKEIDAGLIVMGTHGRKGWQHLMLGSVAERIVRTAPVPVLTVSPEVARGLEGFKEEVIAAR